MIKKRFIKDCLYNLSQSNNPQELTDAQRLYYKGLINGMVSALMENYHNGDMFEKSVKIICENLPNDCIDLRLILPNCWIPVFQKYARIPRFSHKNPKDVYK